jgi:hypothetical protein
VELQHLAVLLALEELIAEDGVFLEGRGGFPGEAGVLPFEEVHLFPEAGHLLL